MAREDILILLSKYVDGTLTSAEQTSLFEWLDSSGREDIEEVMAAYEPIVMNAKVGSPDEELFQGILQQINSFEKSETIIRRRASIFNFWRAAAAILILTLLGTASYYLFRSKPQPPAAVAIAHDVPAPKVTKAIITLSNGKQVALDSLSSGTLARQGNFNISKSNNGVISYELTANGQQPTAVNFNTLTNPRGSQVVSLTLSDGTIVTLNSASSLTYPISFVGNERKVSMTGEVYFEVKHKSRQPFIVAMNGNEVKDIGTQFNINNYDDEDATRVTVIEGSVKVSASEIGNWKSDSRILNSGQQAIINTASNTLKRTSDVNIEEVMAWKNGFFRFNKTGIEEVMKQISRWYDVNVSYPEGVPDEVYGGGISREESLAGIFKVLEESGAHFKIEGKSVTVLP